MKKFIARAFRFEVLWSAFQWCFPSTNHVLKQFFQSVEHQRTLTTILLFQTKHCIPRVTSQRPASLVCRGHCIISSSSSSSSSSDTSSMISYSSSIISYSSSLGPPSLLEFHLPGLGYLHALGQCFSAQCFSLEIFACFVRKSKRRKVLQQENPQKVRDRS